MPEPILETLKSAGRSFYCLIRKLFFCQSDQSRMWCKPSTEHHHRHTEALSACWQYHDVLMLPCSVPRKTCERVQISIQSSICGWKRILTQSPHNLTEPAQRKMKENLLCPDVQRWWRPIHTDVEDASAWQTFGVWLLLQTSMLYFIFLFYLDHFVDFWKHQKTSEQRDSFL